MCVSAADVRQVRSAVCLSREASGRPLGESEPGEEALALQEADGGVRRLRAGEPFPEEMSALWLGVQSLAFTLVCEAHENLLLAEGSLRNLSRHCVEQLHMLGQGTEVSQEHQPGTAAHVAANQTLPLLQPSLLPPLLHFCPFIVFVNCLLNYLWNLKSGSFVCGGQFVGGD